MNSKRVVVIVDPFSSGQLLAPEFRIAGYACVAVHSKPPAENILSGSFVQSDFFEEHVFTGDIEAFAEQLSGYAPLCIIPGAESGIMLADALSNRLGLKHNDILLSRTRRNKFDMQECIKQAGLASIAQLRITSLDEALAEFDRHGGKPMVVKPIASAGSEGVVLCRSTIDIKRAVVAILNTKNMFGDNNDGALIQQYIEGIEYVVDAVSCDGVHVTSNLCRYTKDVVNGAFLYRETRYMAPVGELATQLITYNDRVLDALGIMHGPSHSEIIMTSQGPVLVEVGARLHGGKTSPLVVAKCAQRGPVSLVVQSYVDPKRFLKDASLVNTFDTHAVAFTFASARSGTLRSIPGKPLLEALPSFFDFKLNIGIGNHMTRTVDLNSSPGWVVLEHSDPQVLERDLAYVKRLESNELFELAV